MFLSFGFGIFLAPALCLYKARFGMILFSQNLNLTDERGEGINYLA
jgi:hypothetical protein